MILKMNLEEYSYNIIIKNNALDKLNDEIKEVYNKKKIYIITDSNVGQIYLNNVINTLIDYEVMSIIITPGENSKNIKVYQNVCEKLIDLGLKRGELLVALGGGVVGDLTGFIAGTIYRGTPYVQIPTSLLGQMDSSIGGKTGIDFNGRKNILGVFKQPLKVIIDPCVLKTLPKEEFNNGMGELIKHGCIGSVKLLNLIEKNIMITEQVIYESLQVKQNVVQKDPYDLKERMYLNFGHTFGHIIELEDNLRHGEAVANGMLMAIKMGIDLGITDKSCYSKLKNILLKYDLPIKEYDYKEYIKKSIFDKKNIAGEVTFILISSFGNVLPYKVKESELDSYECKN